MTDREPPTGKLTRLTGDQFKLFQQALVNAFTHQELRELIRVRFDQDMDAFVKPDSKGNVAFDLIGWAERTGNLDALAQAAFQARPANPDVQALAAALPSVSVLPEAELPRTGTAGHGAASAVQQVRLRALEERFAALQAEYKSVNQQLISTLDAQVEVRLKHRIKLIEDELAQLERDMDALKGQR